MIPRINVLLKRAKNLWHSPTIMTWGNLSVRIVGLIVLLPLILRNYSNEESALWLLFQTILSLQLIVDFGFTPTFIRILSYLNSKNDSIKIDLNISEKLTPGSQSTERIIAAMRKIFLRASLISGGLIVTGGSIALIRPISQLNNPIEGWAAWLGVILTSSWVFWGGMFGAYLQGVDKIALYQRRQLVVSLGTVSSGIAVLLLDGGLFPLVLLMQVSGAFGVLYIRDLAIKHAPEKAWSKPLIPDPAIMPLLWPATWRSGIGVAMTYGTIQLTGVIYAQVVPATQSASYLLAQRIAFTLGVFSRVPFYTGIPYMSRKYSENKWPDLIIKARRGMLLSNWCFVLGVISIGMFSHKFLSLIHSQADFVALDVWWLLSIAYLLERIGAMHIQLYSTSNHIVWHIANGISGGLMILTLPVCYHYFGLIGLPIGMIISYGLFYLPYSLYHSYSLFHLNIFKMDMISSIFPLTLLILIYLLTI